MGVRLEPERAHPRERGQARMAVPEARAAIALRPVRSNDDRPRREGRGRYFLDLPDCPDLLILPGRLSARPEGPALGRRRVVATRGPRCY